MNNEKKTTLSENEKYNKVTKVKNPKKNGRFNFIDACLLIIILAVTVSLVAYFLPGITSYFISENQYTIVYEIEFKGVDSEVAKNIKTGSGTPVYDATYNYEIGKIKGSVSYEPHKVLVNSGELTGNTYVGKYEEVPGLVDVKITVEGLANHNYSDGYTINGVRVAVGKQFNIRFAGFSGTGYCSHVAFVESK